MFFSGYFLNKTTAISKDHFKSANTFCNTCFCIIGIIKQYHFPRITLAICSLPYNIRIGVIKPFVGIKCMCVINKNIST